MGEPDHVQTKREIKELLAAAGAEPRKRFGQHFLIDGNLMRLLVRSADLGPEDHVLEVGGGTGGLTDLLVGQVRELLCVEVDHSLHALMEQRFSGTENLRLLRADVLESKHRLNTEVALWLNSCASEPPAPVKLVANLPYQIATPLVMNLLVDYPQVQRLCFMVQAEVADRFTAPAGCGDYGPASITAQTLCRVEAIARAPGQAFWPRPAVDSKIIRMERVQSPFAGRDEVRRFVELVRRLFEHRRKTLRTSLKLVLNDAALEQIAAKFDLSRRPESLEVAEWLGLNRLLVDI